MVTQKTPKSLLIMHILQMLAAALAALRPAATGKLAVLFGCGGDRDKSKRAEMGQLPMTALTRSSSLTITPARKMRPASGRQLSQPVQTPLK